jgi:hypothetical protein
VEFKAVHSKDSALLRCKARGDYKVTVLSWIIITCYYRYCTADLSYCFWRSLRQCIMLHARPSQILFIGFSAQTWVLNTNMANRGKHFFPPLFLNQSACMSYDLCFSLCPSRLFTCKRIHN